MGIATFLGFESKGAKARPQTLESLACVEHYPVLDARALIELLGVGGKISAIRSLAAVSPEQYERLYVPSIYRFLEAAQLQPASTTDHHAGLGGLITHTLEVIETAMMKRRAYHLPPNTDPELIAREEKTWTYGVFAAALLHDAGKLLTMTTLVPDNGARYSPLGKSILDTGTKTYTIEFVSSSTANSLYELQMRISVALLSLLPKEGLTMIGTNPRLLSELTGWLSNQPYEWGIIGKLCHDADRRSVRNNLQPGQSRQQIPSAPTLSLASRLMRALRAEIERLSIPLNRDGATGWTQNGTLWLVCKTAVQRARTRLEEEGSTDVPRDDERLFDILMDHGYVIPTEDGRAIWNVRITCDQYDHALTMLRFELSRAVHPSRKVIEFDGQITPITQDELRTIRQAQHAPQPSEPTHDSAASAQSTPVEPSQMPEPEWVSAATDQTPTVQDEPPPSPTLPKQKKSSNAKTDKPMNSRPALTKPGRSGSGQTNTIPQAVPSSANHVFPVAPLPSAPDAAQISANALNDAVKRERSQLTQDPVPIDHEHLGRYFLTWLYDAIRAEVIRLDSSAPPVHILENNIALVWPKLAHRFFHETGLEMSQDKATRKAASNKLRRNLKVNELLESRAKGYDVWQVQMPTRAGMTITTLFCVIIPTWTLFNADEVPPFNKDLTLRFGDYPPNDRPVMTGRKNAKATPTVTPKNRK